MRLWEISLRPPLQNGRPARIDHVAIRTFQLSARSDEIIVEFAHLRLSVEKKIDVIAGQSRVERRSEPLAGNRWSDQARRHDHDQIGLFLPERGAPKQCPKNRDRADPWKL